VGVKLLGEQRQSLRYAKVTRSAGIGVQMGLLWRPGTHIYEPMWFFGGSDGLQGTGAEAINGVMSTGSCYRWVKMMSGRGTEEGLRQERNYAWRQVVTV
jgi:hypothetical protein